MEWEPQYPSATSNPTSVPNQSGGTNSARSEKVPTLKQISPSPAVSALSKLTDDELRRKGVEDLLRILRRVETDYKTLLGEHGNMVKDVNRRIQIFMLETRSLKEVNQKLQDDNQELRDLCCFLDDDRQRGRKLAREWQRFGRYTASVMRSEVAVYQEKLRELEDKQNELITENMELKELCLFLDQERVRMTGDRDEGDGSSNGTVTGHEDGIVSMETAGSAIQNLTTQGTDSYPISPSSAASYIRELELKVRLLEDERKLLSQKVDRNSADGLDIISSMYDSRSAGHIMAADSDKSLHGSKSGTTLLRKSPVSSKPETVMHAMKVLQVHEELEKTPTEDEDLADPEKAIVREMCNVVWRTLGDIEDIGSFNESSDSIQEPPFITTDSTGKSNNLQGAETLYNQGHAYSYTGVQPPITSTPVPAGMKQLNVGNQPLSVTADGYSGPTSYHMQPQRNSSTRLLQEPKPQPSGQHTQSQNDPGMRSRQNSVSERLAADRSRNLPYKQFIERPEDKRNPEQKTSHITPDTGGVPLHLQQLPHHLPLQQPPSHQQQYSGDNPYPQQRSTDLSSRLVHQPSHFQQPPSMQQQGLSEINTHSHPSQRSADVTSKSIDQTQRYQQRPSPPQHPSSTTLPGNQNQRSVDFQSNKAQSDLPSTANFTGNPSQHQRNTQARPHQQVKLLDAPGSGRHSQRSAPTQSQVNSKDRLQEESIALGQTRQHSRGDIAYGERNSSERDTQAHPAPRSVSSSSVLNPTNSQLSAHNLHGGKSTQNLKGPSVFRAYPPQLTSMPNQPVSLRGSQGQELSSRSNPAQPDPTRGSYQPDSQPQNMNIIASKRFQEQEWRQNYLDESDTL